ncbi:dNA primase [Mycoplasma sp. CAG:956]|nr:dNA primase [Mycoplasma sp. CAG:956]
MFPLYDTEGHVIGYSARIYRGEAIAKYINTKETYLYKKGNYLYNYHLAKDEAKRSKKLIIVEGQMDAIRLYINGIKNVVALMGTALTKEQVELIKRLRCDVILGLDGDNAGKMATLKNGEILTQNNINVQVIRINLKKDPDEYVFTYGIDGYLKMINNPIDYLDFKLNTLKDDINPENTVELTNFINKVLDDLKTIKDPIYIDVSLTKLSKSTGIDKEVLKSRLNEMSSLKTITQEVFKKEEQIVPPSANLLDKITKKMLYYMLNDRKYVLEYQEKIGYFPNKIYRSIANEIVFFIGKNYNITVADFISYISYNEALSGEVLKIIDEDEDVSDEDFELVIKSYQRQKNKEDIEILKQKLASELDREHQLKILEQIKNIKKGSVE